MARGLPDDSSGWQLLGDGLARMAERVEELARHDAEQQALALERLTAVQRMALMSIEEAREQARFWKQAAQLARDDASVKADAYRQAMLAAQSEARRLSERVRELEGLLAGVRRGERTRGPGAETSRSYETRAPRVAAPTPSSMRVRAFDPDGPSE